MCKSLISKKNQTYSVKVGLSKKDSKDIREPFFINIRLHFICFYHLMS